MTKLVPILDLRPTQFALGMFETKRKVKKYAKMSSKDLKMKLKQTVALVVKAPNSDLYIVDGHHHAYVVWLLGFKAIRAKIVKDFSKNKMSYNEFWKKMDAKNYCHLYDQFGEGPRDPIYLPRDIRGLADDPYRSLAWLAEKNGGYKKSKERFSDFKWSNFFRKNKIIPKKFDQNLEEIGKIAAKIARRSEARHFPGFIP